MSSGILECRFVVDGKTVASGDAVVHDLTGVNRGVLISRAAELAAAQIIEALAKKEAA